MAGRDSTKNFTTGECIINGYSNICQAAYRIYNAAIRINVCNESRETYEAGSLLRAHSLRRFFGDKVNWLRFDSRNRTRELKSAISRWHAVSLRTIITAFIRPAATTGIINAVASTTCCKFNGILRTHAGNTREICGTHRRKLACQYDAEISHYESKN